VPDRNIRPAAARSGNFRAWLPFVRVRIVLDKGKPVARRGRKTQGPRIAEVAQLPRRTMNLITKAAATVATAALLLPGTALAGKGATHGKSGKAEAEAPAAALTQPSTTDATAPAGAPAPAKSGKAGAPGQVCKGLKVKGKKTAAQRAAYKACIKDAVAKRKAEHAAKAKAKDDAESDDDAKPESDDDAAVTPAPVVPVVPVV
jgi:hypothetical protein